MNHRMIITKVNFLLKVYIVSSTFCLDTMLLKKEYNLSLLKKYAG